MPASAIEYQPMTTVKLYGQLSQFGRSFRLSVRTPAEATLRLTSCGFHALKRTSGLSLHKIAKCSALESYWLAFLKSVSGA
jgi:predicted phage tail protein